MAKKLFSVSGVDGKLDLEIVEKVVRVPQDQYIDEVVEVPQIEYVDRNGER